MARVVAGGARRVTSLPPAARRRLGRQSSADPIPLPPASASGSAGGYRGRAGHAASTSEVSDAQAAPVSRMPVPRLALGASPAALPCIPDAGSPAAPVARLQLGSPFDRSAPSATIPGTAGRAGPQSPPRRSPSGGLEVGASAGQEAASSGLPSGFVFSGDLDEDVERLEALEQASTAHSSARFRTRIALVLSPSSPQRVRPIPPACLLRQCLP